MDAQLAQLVVNGVAVGSIIALSAIGLTLTFGILRLSNFAHGDFMAIGAYLTLFTNALGVNIWLAMVVGAVGTAGLMLVGEKLIWSVMRDRRANSTTLIIISIGLSFILRNGIILLWGSENQTYRLPVMPAITFLGLRIAYSNLVVVILAFVAMIAIHLIFQRTKIGKAMRAVADDLDLARVSGIDVEWVVLCTWILAGVLTGVSGGLYGLVTAVRPTMGWFLILPLFAAIILGGIGNPYGAIAGAMVIGITQEVSTLIIPNEYKLAVAFIVMMVVLLIRPQGLFRSTLS
ncbi:branched-chain amino acid ABC transporter permease [Candidatus Synechococcus calcipolaris G9]|uniref:Branched-chain amino acid ABC transporter permease n=1 Tax=Candidatus Synechococcus calcipolaris G9 TaxID=1497997 RepID=A0ABT6EZW1_9SYNE|nr:branched-chain amino acid ABC transporter permease [Candidatus Synechococcus calcipolaris]MDG2991112.1 branched-chain amino acid ABC transporter permease [Candidatus Synechococcus calcipolaris G9]